MADNIFGYPNYISNSGGGGTTYVAGTGLQATANGNGTYTLSASGPYITWYYEPGIPNSKYIKAGNNVTLVYDASGGITLNAQVTGSGATSSGSYLVAITEASLPNARVATQGNGITISDGGGGGNMTFGLSSSVTNSKLLTWDVGDTIFPDRRTFIPGSGLSAAYGTNTLTLSVTGLTNGTVTSVDLAVPSILTLSGNPITTAGTITIGLANQPSGLVWCGPASGANTAPTFRQLTYLDMPLVAGANITFTPSGRNWIVASTGGGGGGVTSVDVAVPASLLTSTGGPITTSGTITLGLATVPSGLFWSGPSSGSATTPSYRAITTTDLPNSIPATKIANGTVSDAEFQYLDGVTSGIQGQLDAKQPLDATLTALAAYNTNGILTQTAADTFTGRTITGTANEITVTNGNGVSGNPVVSLATGIDPAKLANGSVSATEFQYLDGVTSAIQGQLDGKASNAEAFVTLGNTTGLSNERRLAVAGGLTIQDGGANNAVTISGSALQPLDATLTALAAYNTNGIITQTAPDTFAGVTLAAAGGLTIQQVGSVITYSASGVAGGGSDGFGGNGARTLPASGSISGDYYHSGDWTANGVLTIADGTRIFVRNCAIFDMGSFSHVVSTRANSGGAGRPTSSNAVQSIAIGSGPGAAAISGGEAVSVCAGAGGPGFGGRGGRGGSYSDHYMPGGAVYTPRQFFGGTGGSSGMAYSSTSTAGANGGNAGGGFYLEIALTTGGSAILGNINLNGANGTTSPTTNYSGSAGGTGGCFVARIRGTCSIPSGITISANGGNGGNASTSSEAAAGGAGGGWIDIQATTLTNSGTLQANGGSAGTGGNYTASAGSAGQTSATSLGYDPCSFW